MEVNLNTKKIPDWVAIGIITAITIASLYLCIKVVIHETGYDQQIRARYKSVGY